MQSATQGFLIAGRMYRRDEWCPEIKHEDEEEDERLPETEELDTGIKPREG